MQEGPTDDTTRDERELATGPGQESPGGKGAVELQKRRARLRKRGRGNKLRGITPSAAALPIHPQINPGRAGNQNVGAGGEGRASGDGDRILCAIRDAHILRNDMSMQCCVLIDACMIRDHPLITTLFDEGWRPTRRSAPGRIWWALPAPSAGPVGLIPCLGRIMLTLHVCSGVFPVRGRDGSDGRARGNGFSSPSRLWFRVRLQTRRIPWADTRSYYPREARNKLLRRVIPPCNRRRSGIIPCRDAHRKRAAESPVNLTHIGTQ